MTYQATIHLKQATNTNISQYLIFQLDANSPETAHHQIKQRWKKIKRQLPNISVPKLVEVKEAVPCCPQCGATELSFCHHPKEEAANFFNTT